MENAKVLSVYKHIGTSYYILLLTYKGFELLWIIVMISEAD